MKVICKKNEYTYEYNWYVLTLGKIYIVKSFSKYSYGIINDRGKYKVYPRVFFDLYNE